MRSVRERLIKILGRFTEAFYELFHRVVPTTVIAFGEEMERDGKKRALRPRVKNRGGDGRINRKHGRVSVFPVVGHDTGLPGVCTPHSLVR